MRISLSEFRNVSSDSTFRDLLSGEIHCLLDDLSGLLSIHQMIMLIYSVLLLFHFFDSVISHFDTSLTKKRILRHKYSYIIIQ